MFIAKSNPIVRKSGDGLEIWSYYQEWGGRGTALSFYVPELRKLYDDSGEVRIVKSALPSELSDWPVLDDVGSIGIFVAGISQLNPDIMEAILPHLSESDLEHFELQDLPTSESDLRALIGKVREARKLHEVFSTFKLNWTP